MGISTIKGIMGYIKKNSNFSGRTIHSVILNLGFHLWDKEKEFKKLSGILTQCSLKGANSGFSGFSYISDTVYFFLKHRKDIVKNMERTAEDCGIDILSMVQEFGVFKNTKKPSISNIGKALWDSGLYNPKLNNLYQVFAWYALEEIAHTWQRYLEENPSVVKSLLA